jgi:hypothetical protein
MEMGSLFRRRAGGADQIPASCPFRNYRPLTPSRAARRTAGDNSGYGRVRRRSGRRVRLAANYADLPPKRRRRMGLLEFELDLGICGRAEWFRAGQSRDPCSRRRRSLVALPAKWRWRRPPVRLSPASGHCRGHCRLRGPHCELWGSAALLAFPRTPAPSRACHQRSAGADFVSRRPAGASCPGWHRRRIRLGVPHRDRPPSWRVTPNCSSGHPFGSGTAVFPFRPRVRRLA